MYVLLSIRICVLRVHVEYKLSLLAKIQLKRRNFIYRRPGSIEKINKRKGGKREEKETKNGTGREKRRKGKRERGEKRKKKKMRQKQKAGTYIELNTCFECEKSWSQWKNSRSKRNFEIPEMLMFLLQNDLVWFNGIFISNEGEQIADEFQSKFGAAFEASIDRFISV